MDRVRSGGQSRTNQNVRGDVSSGKQTQLIHNSWTVSDRLGLPAGGSERAVSAGVRSKSVL